MSWEKARRDDLNEMWIWNEKFNYTIETRASLEKKERKQEKFRKRKSQYDFLPILWWLDLNTIGQQAEHAATTQNHRMITIVAFKYVVLMQRDHETIGQPKLQYFGEIDHNEIQINGYKQLLKKSERKKGNRKKNQQQQRRHASWFSTYPEKPLGLLTNTRYRNSP